MNVCFRICSFLLCLPALVLALQDAVPSGTPAGTQAAPAPQATNPQLVLRPPPNPDDTEGKIRLDVVVTNKQGESVSGLEVKDFTVLDNKKKQDILSFHSIEIPAGEAGRPVEVILLLDLVNSTFEQASIARTQMEKYLVQNGGHLKYPTSIMVLTPEGLRRQPHPSTDGNALAALVGQANPAVHSAAFGEAGRFQLSVRSLDSIAENETKSSSRKILIWTGPGWPMMAGTSYASSSQDRARTFEAIVEISTRMREAHIALYNISAGGSATAGTPGVLAAPRGGALLQGAEAPGQSRSGPIMTNTPEDANYKEFLRGVKSAQQADSGDLALQVLAVQSGGRVLDPSNDLAGQVSKCVEDLSAFYTIYFTPAHADHANDYHDVKVQVARPGLAARTNTGYYNQP